MDPDALDVGGPGTVRPNWGPPPPLQEERRRVTVIFLSAVDGSSLIYLTAADLQRRLTVNFLTVAERRRSQRRCASGL